MDLVFELLDEAARIDLCGGAIDLVAADMLRAAAERIALLESRAQVGN